MSSRLAVDAHGQRIAVVTSPSLGLDTGTRFWVLGDALPSAERGFLFTGVRTGRPNAVTVPRKTNRDPLPVDPAHGATSVPQPRAMRSRR